MKTIPALALAALVLVLSSCDLLTGPRTRGDLQAEAHPPELHLTNAGTATVYYAVFEGALAARTLWGPCDRPNQCPGVTPGAQIRIPYDSVPGYHEVSEPVALVYWWHLFPTGNGFKPDSVRVVHVPL